MKETLTNPDGQRPDSWPSRDRLYMTFYKIIYGKVLDDTVIEQTLLARKGAIAMTPEYKESYLKKLRASGENHEQVNNQITGLITPLAERDQELIISCLGLSSWRIPTLSETVEALNTSEKEIEDALQRMSAALESR